ncbi:hypothetical protein evm_013763 [Chilo suppressalis]|nr:hypothetical protein evm_013763 [Chilo suppressalis]
MDLSWPRIRDNNVNSAASGSRSDAQDIFNRGSIGAEQRGPIIYGKPKKKQKRYRYAFTTDQTLYLENIFMKGRYITANQRKELAQKIGASDRSIKVWFQNRRTKEKLALKEKAEEEDLRANGFSPEIILTPAISDRSPQIVSPPQPMFEPNLVANLINNPEISIEPIIDFTPSAFRPNYYQDRSPVRNALSTASLNTSSPSKSDSYEYSSEYKASAEFSIDLCKKYKNILTKYKSEGNLATDNTNFLPLPSSPFDLRVNIEKPEIQDEPQDLSMKKSDSTKCHDSIRKSSTFVNIPQPALPDVPIWEVLTLPPVAHNTIPAASISILPAPPSSKPDNYEVPKRSCNCCKCPKQPIPSTSSSNEEPQYIINVVPYQNYKK